MLRSFGGNISVGKKKADQGFKSTHFMHLHRDYQLLFSGKPSYDGYQLIGCLMLQLNIFTVSLCQKKLVSLPISSWPHIPNLFCVTEKPQNFDILFLNSYCRNSNCSLVSSNSSSYKVEGLAQSLLL